MTFALPAAVNGVSCPVATFCAAVGSYEIKRDAGIPLVDVWDGARWTLHSAAVPSAATNAELSAVSCSSATTCAAVGWYAVAGGPREPLAEVWDGVGWTPQSIVFPSGMQSNGYGLSSVSCPSTTSCIAVGSAYDTAGGHDVLLAEVWDGVGWTPQTIVLPSGLVGYDFLVGSSVSCPSTTSCIAVGSAYDTAGGHEVLLAEVWDGVGWTPQTIALPSATTVLGISCPSTTSCIAVGYYQTGDLHTLPLAEVWDGVRWTPQTIPLPRGMYNATLTSVSCSSITYCTVLGSEVIHWDGTTWSIDRDFPASGPVSCASNTTCTVIANHDLLPPVAFRSS